MKLFVLWILAVFASEKNENGTENNAPNGEKIGNKKMEKKIGDKKMDKKKIGDKKIQNHDIPPGKEGVEKVVCFVKRNLLDSTLS